MQSKKVFILSVVAAFVIGGVAGYIIGGAPSARPGGQAGGDDVSQQIRVPQNAAAMISELKAKVNENPKDADNLMRLADAYFDQKQFGESVNYYRKVLEIKPDDADVYTEIGLSLHYLGESQEDIKYLDEGIRRNPYHQRIWLTKGFVLAGMGDIKSAKKAWEKTRALNPESRIGKAAADYLSQIAVKKQETAR